MTDAFICRLISIPLVLGMTNNIIHLFSHSTFLPQRCATEVFYETNNTILISKGMYSLPVEHTNGG
jgi:hypothetical protein